MTNRLERLNGGPTKVGTKAIELRRTPMGTREFVSDIVDYDPPRRLVARVSANAAVPQCLGVS